MHLCWFQFLKLQFLYVSEHSLEHSYGTKYIVCIVLPLKAESHNCEDGGVDNGLHEDDLCITRQVPQGPGILNPNRVKLQRHTLQIHTFVFDIFFINKEILTKNKRKYICDGQICEVDICCISTILIF